MPITSITPDAEALTLTVTGEYPVPVERLWEAYADPRQIEKFWGPETWPAKFLRHDMAAGGQSQYAMTGPDGSVSRGYWHFLSVEPGRRFEVEDGFADEEGNLNRSMPVMRMVYEFEPTAGGSRVVSTTHFPSADAMDELSAMGMLEGLRSAMGQLDAVVADDRTFAADRPLDTQILSDTRVRFSRVVQGSVEQVWRAHHEPEVMRRWMLGPEGWTMPVCEVGSEVGDAYRTEWEAADGSERFGFEGELLEVAPPYREVSTDG